MQSTATAWHRLPACGDGGRPVCPTAKMAVPRPESAPPHFIRSNVFCKMSRSLAPPSWITKPEIRRDCEIWRPSGTNDGSRGLQPTVLVGRRAVSRSDTCMRPRFSNVVPRRRPDLGRSVGCSPRQTGKAIWRIPWLTPGDNRGTPLGNTRFFQTETLPIGAVLPPATKHRLLAVATVTLRAACGRLCRFAPFPGMVAFPSPPAWERVA